MPVLRTSSGVDPAGDLAFYDRLRQAAGLLQTEAAYRADQQDAAGTSRSIRACLRLGDSLAEAPTVVAQLVRVACHGCAVDAVARALSGSISFTDGQSAELAQALTEAQRVTKLSMARAFAGERILYPSQAPFLFRQGYRTNLARMALAAAEPPPERLVKLKAVVPAPAKKRFLTSTTAMVAPAFQRALEADLEILARLRAARTALAIERYRADRGQLPEPLDELVPAYLDAIPEDPHNASSNGAPLLYKRLDTGYVVYSVGVDGQDNGGDIRRRGPLSPDEGIAVKPQQDIVAP